MTGEEALDDLFSLRWKKAMIQKLSINCQQEPMLINVVKPMNLPEGMTCATSVWFDSVDGIYGGLPHSLYLSRAFDFVYRRGLVNGKVYTAKRAGDSSADSYQVMGEMVQGTPQIVDSISNNKRNDRGDVFSHRQIVSALSPLNIIIISDVISVVFEKHLPLGFEITDVLFGPF